MGIETMHTQPTLVYSRYVDGGQPVHIQSIEATSGGSGSTIYTLSTPGGETFQSARQLLIALTGHPHGRHWTFDRYFRLGKYAPALRRIGEPELSIVDMMAVTTAGPIILVHGSTKQLGIDLQKRGREVAKLLMAGFGRRIFASGYDFEDVLQEVYLALQVRNEGTCPWDAAKSSFGHYVHMVCSCVLSNYQRKYSRQRGHGLEVAWPHGGEPDMGSTRVLEGGDQHVADDLARFIETNMKGASPQERSLILQTLPHVQAGLGRSELAQALGVSKPMASKALSALRQITHRWQRFTVAD